MITLLVVVFIVGYLAIALEHPIKVNKTASALLTAVIMWSIFVLSSNSMVDVNWESFKHFMTIEGLTEVTDLVKNHFVTHELSHHLADIAEILFFLLGAMTIVELIDAHQGFKVITNRITTRDSRKLLWIISILTFFLSAALDNLTTSIVMVSLLRKLIHNDEQRKFFAGVVIIAANAGGAWSPIGDVTTTMLWIGGQITAANIISTLIIPSLVCMIVPLIYLSFKMRGEVERGDYDNAAAIEAESVRGSKLMLFLGVGMLLFVPIFKTITHLPPYMGMLFGLGVMWLASEIIHSDRDEEERKPYSAVHALSKIDTSSVLFFLGILVAIHALQSTYVLKQLAVWMNDTIGDLNIIAMAIGLLSSIVDNVPLVAASMGMYDMAGPMVNPEIYHYALEHKELIQDGMIIMEGTKYYLVDAKIWEFIAYTAGTGGSALIIGSAAGVAVMGMEKIDFIWYMKKISLLAILGFFAGAFVYIALHPIFAIY
ncbi:MAG: sodium:proton antiporter [Bacteroidetes bacterium]|nr:MAG: sodium:proton antiporter [Bacteroidota bacterium]